MALLAFASCKGGKDIAEEDDLSRQKKVALRDLFIEASMEISLDNDERARALLKKCLEIAPENAACYHELAKIEERSQNYGMSMEYAEKAYDLDEDNNWYLIHLAGIYKSRRDFEQAEKLYKKAVDIDNSKLGYLFPYAEVLLMQNKIEEALEIFDMVEERYGINEELTLQKYDLYMEIGKPQDALNELKRLVESDPTEIRYKGMLAEGYEQLGMREEAAEMYRQMLELDPDNGRVHLAQYRTLLYEGKQDEAFDALRSAFRDPSLGIDTKVQITLDFYSLSERDSSLMDVAMDLLEILADVHPKEAKTYAVYGDFLIRDGRKTEARDMFLKALMFDKDKYVIWNQVLLLDAQISDWKGLDVHAEEAVTLFPNQPAFYYYHGYANFMLKEYEPAIEILEMARSLIVDDKGLMAEVLQTLGDSYYKAGMKDEAYSVYDACLEIDKENVFLLNNYSYYLALDNKNLEKAVNMAKLANEILPGQSSFQDTYAYALFKIGRYEEAKEWIEKAIGEGSPSATLLEHYGDILFKLGKEDKAVEKWEEALDKGSGSETLMKKVEDKKYYED